MTNLGNSSEAFALVDVARNIEDFNLRHPEGYPETAIAGLYKALAENVDVNADFDTDPDAEDFTLDRVVQ